MGTSRGTRPKMHAPQHVSDKSEEDGYSTLTAPRRARGESAGRELRVGVPAPFEPLHPEATNYQWVLKKAMSLIEQDLAKVETCIVQGLASSDPSIQPMLDHVRTLGGKRLRPCLTLLSAKACGGVTEETIRLAAAIELVHTATLVHDDILDGADQRRHRPTTHTLWGVQDAILLGDWLFTHAYELANQGESTYPGRCIARAAKLVCEGEIRQGRSVGNLDLAESDYYDILGAKTGALCEVSCRLGAWSANASDSISERFAQYGYGLGVAFQIYDDWLDIWGDAASTGKTLGTDLEARKPTLPVIHALASPGGQGLRDVLVASDAVSFPKVRSYFDAVGASEYTLDSAHQWGRRAISHLNRMDGVYTAHQESLQALQLLAYAATHRAA
ncbi:Octaprenyl-diphosphate synthase [Pirellula sp. SH-Sr6A]|nr:Octaprenyl-diphosphate synthase [Pirellula sp. SH-Sr6A]